MMSNCSDLLDTLSAEPLRCAGPLCEALELCGALVRSP